MIACLDVAYPADEDAPGPSANDNGEAHGQHEAHAQREARAQRDGHTPAPTDRPSGARPVGAGSSHPRGDANGNSAAVNLYGIEHPVPTSHRIAHAAVVALEDWTSVRPLTSLVVPIADVAPYVPGSFYLRELPCLRAVLHALAARLGAFPSIAVVDGHVWTAPQTPGLGARLLSAEPRLRTVVGVAKNRYVTSPATAVLRGLSNVPVWVDEAGAFVDAPARIAQMPGGHRLPAMLKKVDRLCRGLEEPLE